MLCGTETGCAIGLHAAYALCVPCLCSSTGALAVSIAYVDSSQVHGHRLRCGECAAQADAEDQRSERKKKKEKRKKLDDECGTEKGDAPPGHEEEARRSACPAPRQGEIGRNLRRGKVR
eukprot:3198864-Rhodomonas_salina.1